MIISRLEGGLGNLMFEYSLGRSLSLKNKTDLKFDISSYRTNPLADCSFWLEAFNIEIEKNLASPREISYFKRFQKKTGKGSFLYNMIFADKTKYFKEEYYNFNPEALTLKDNVFLHGWWQSEKYFSNIREILLEDFTLKNSLSGRNKQIAGMIESTNSVGIHVRGRDYVTNPKTKNVHGQLPYDYYNRAIDIIALKVKDPVLFVFSDDAKWAKKNFQWNFETIYVEGNDYLLSPHEDMRLMSLCKHNIIANSSFGWWGAWLNKNQGKLVVAPDKWVAKSSKEQTKDVIPDSWIKLDVNYLR